MIRTLFYFFWLIILTACENKSNYRKAADEIAANAPEPVNMNAGKKNYSLDIPKGWTTEYRNAYGVEYYFLLAPKTVDDPNTNINLITEDMRNLSLTDYKNGSIASLRRSIPSASIVAEGDIVANEIKGCWYSYKMEQQGIKATLVNYIFPKDGIAYTITAGTQTKDASRYKKTFDNVAKSLKFPE